MVEVDAWALLWGGLRGLRLLLRLGLRDRGLRLQDLDVARV